MSSFLVISPSWPLGATHLILDFIDLLLLLEKSFPYLATPHSFVFMRGNSRLERSDVNVFVSLIMQL